MGIICPLGASYRPPSGREGDINNYITSHRGRHRAKFTMCQPFSIEYSAIMRHIRKNEQKLTKNPQKSAKNLHKIQWNEAVNTQLSHQHLIKCARLSNNLHIFLYRAISGPRYDLLAPASGGESEYLDSLVGGRGSVFYLLG